MEGAGVNACPVVYGHEIIIAGQPRIGSEARADLHLKRYTQRRVAHLPECSKIFLTNRVIEMTDLETHSVTAAHYYDRATGIAAYLQSAVLLILRITWGWQLLESGYGHLTHVQKTVDAFRSWGVPSPQTSVYISGTTELVGGILLVIGLAARLISVPLVFNFLVAYATASRDTFKQIVVSPRDGYDAFINDSAFPMLMLALIVLAFGPGWISIDHLLLRNVFHVRSRWDQRSKVG